jgi:hypothetical protein
MKDPKKEDLERLALRLNRMRSSKKGIGVNGRLQIINRSEEGFSGRVLPLDLHSGTKGLTIAIEEKYPDSPIPKGRRVYALFYQGQRISLETEGNWRYAQDGMGGWIETLLYNFQEGAKAKLTLR